MTRAEETRAIKAALKAAGVPVKRVGHGTGTASGWIEVTLSCPREERDKWEGQALEIICAVTKRNPTRPHRDDILIQTV